MTDYTVVFARTSKALMVDNISDGHQAERKDGMRTSARRVTTPFAGLPIRC
jgi:hypothetical protein